MVQQAEPIEVSTTTSIVRITVAIGRNRVVRRLLAAAGLYGSLTHASGRRKRELGTRMAIGAERGGVLLLVLKECAYRVPDF